jgi:hypothetical protein
MPTEPQPNPETGIPAGQDSVEMPRPTVAPMVMSLGLLLLGAGVVFGLAFLIVGGLILVAGLGLWIADLLPGQGHVHEHLVEPAQRPRPIQPAPGTVETLREGMPGHRLRLPEKVHPISAGVKGGIVGGLVMPVPALLYGLISGHGIWYPVNLLAGMVLPGIEDMKTKELEEFHLSLVLAGVIIHAAMSVVLGLIYGVLLPTLPNLPKPLAWGGLLMPLLWTGFSFLLIGFVNPVLQQGVDWPWFIVSQFIFGIVAAGVVMRATQLSPVPAGLLGGLLGGVLMPIPAVLWSLAAGHGLWYPLNLLAGMALPRIGNLPVEQQELFQADWLVAGVIIHLILSLSFGIIYGLVLPKVPPIPTPIAWGGLLLPLLWTVVSYGLMGVVNPALQERVNWPWFIVSQFLFGLAAAFVVNRSEMIYIPPAGQGPDRGAEFLTRQRMKDEG